MRKRAKFSNSPPPTIQTSTSSDSLSTWLGSTFSSALRLPVDCENSRFCPGCGRALKEFVILQWWRLLFGASGDKRRPELTVETVVRDDGQVRDEDRISRFSRKRAAPLEAMIDN